MNLPNKLTVLRVCLIPVFLVLYLLPFSAWSRFAALAVFAGASFTDMLDGQIARKYNLITNFGKLMDPLADKMLVAAALVAMTQTGEVAAWVVVVIISREFLITGFRMLALEQGKVIAASSWGKLKTVSQMTLILAILLGFIPTPVTDILSWVTAALTLGSAIDYVAKNKGIF
ncbi:MAG: CDP-diacylglycerol--glycerol-3-phosphate 3-phosphatidyltransferase [Clostridiales bacterium]|nr:CDP-diacylglycerol--glycerol-3-phosphate 3-phosphatidyltransferase [Clostridiales bacterium]